MFFEDLRWKSPGNAIISGPSFSGKTTLIDKIIRRKKYLFKNGERKKVLLYCLSPDQKIYQQWEDDNLLAFRAKGVPDIDTFIETVNFYGKSGAIVIFDDLGAEIKANSKFFRELFLVLTHHMNLNVFLILHNIFPEGLRELSLNTHRFLITYNPRDSLGISTLGRQCYPGSKNFLTSVYKHVGKTKYGYLVLDFHQETNPVLRVTSNWFGEWGNYIMAYQESGACSSVPYKCLHIISSELYNSLIEKTECSEDGKSNVINTSSNSSPSFQNNFYPQNNLLSSGYHGGNNRFDGDDDDDNGTAPRPQPQLVHPSPSNLTPTMSPIQLPEQHSSEKSPHHFTNDDGATSNIGDPVDDLVDIPSPIIDSSTNVDDMDKVIKTNDNVTQSTPSHPSMLKERLTRRSFFNKKPYNIKSYKSSSSSIIPKKEESIPKKEEPMDTSLAPSVSNISPSSTQVTPHSSIKSFLPSKDGPKLSKATSKLKDEVKWSPQNKHQEVKMRKPLSKTKPEPKKRSFKFERNIPKIEDDLNDPMNGTYIEHIPLNENDEKMDTHIEHIPLNENDEKMDIGNFKFRRGDTYANTYKNRKYPRMTRKQNSVLKNISNDDLAKKKLKPKIRVRTDLFDKIPDTVVKEISKDDVLKQMTKPKIRVRTDLFKETPENNVSNKSSSNSLFKRTNNSSKKNVEKKQEYIRNIEKDKNKSLREKNKKEIAKNVRNFFAKNKQTNNAKFKVPPLKKSQFNETSNKLNSDFEMTDDSKIKIEKKIKPDKDSKTPLLIKRKIKKEIIEKGKNTKLSRNIKREIIGDEMIKSKVKPHNESKTLLNKKKIKKEIIEKGKNTKLSREIKREMIGEEMIKSKRKNPFATHQTGAVKISKKKHKEIHDKEMKGSKRKNFFGTHPTGPIKFVKKNIKEKNDDTDNDNKDFKKKFSGSGFNMWKI